MALSYSPSPAIHHERNGMGRKNTKNKKTERLPPSERTLVGAKVSLNSHAVTNVQTTVRVYEPPQPFELSTPLPRTPRGDPVNLDIDALRKILRHAGALTLLTALRVSRAWRRAALEELSCTPRLHLSDAMRRAGLRTTPSAHWVIRTLNYFPCLRHITLSGLPHLGRIPDLTTKVLSELSSATCTTLDMSRLDVAAADLANLIRSPRMPALTELILTGCQTVDASCSRLLADALIASGRTLERVDVSNCGRVDADALMPLLIRNTVLHVVAKRCINVRRVTSLLALTASSVDLHHCRNLGRFHVTTGVLIVLNLSQCASLVSVRLARAPSAQHKLETVNLASCHNLRELSVDGGLPCVEELLLSRARSLRADTFMHLGLHAEACAMPRLRRLELIATNVREVRLRSYGALQCADLSGCADLNVVHISDCDRLAKLNLSNRKAPLGRVDAVLSKDAVVLGLRDRWAWSANDRMQTIVYGTQ